MWILTYVGAFFNGLTLLILGESQRADDVTSLRVEVCVLTPSGGVLGTCTGRFCLHQRTKTKSQINVTFVKQEVKMSCCKVQTQVHLHKHSAASSPPAGVIAVFSCPIIYEKHQVRAHFTHNAPACRFEGV